MGNMYVEDAVCCAVCCCVLYGARCAVCGVRCEVYVRVADAS